MTDAVIFKNNASSRLGIDIPAASITITVEPGTGVRFPSPAAAQFFPVIVNDRRTGQFEIMYCTQRVNDILTVTRAQEGTAAQNFLLGASVWSTATAGTYQTYFNYSWSKDEADARFVNAAGDTMTGALTLPGNPTIGKHATTKEWVEALAATITSLTEAPNDGQPYARQSIGWVVSVTRAAYDANNVAISNAFASDDADIAALQAAMLLRITDAPSNGNEYVRKNAAWSVLTAAITDAPADGTRYVRKDNAWLQQTAATLLVDIKAVDGAGSGLDADLLDGLTSTDFLKIIGGTLTGNLTIAPAANSAQYILSKSAGAFYNIILGTTAGSTRWQVIPGDASLESGANVGSDFVINRYSDTGVFLSAPFGINRATGLVTLPNGATTVTASPGDNDTSVATTAFVTAADAVVTAAYQAADAVVTAAYQAADAVVTTAIASTGLVAQGRLSLTTGLAVTTADVIGGATLFYVPYVGKNISLYSGTAWVNRSIGAQISLPLLGLLANAKPHDVFIFDNAGTPTLEVFAWTNDTARATALVLQDGIWCKTGALTRRYVGTIYATGTGTTEDSLAKRFVWNMNNRVNRPMSLFDPVDSYTYASATIRQMNGSVTNQLDFVRGFDEDRVEAEALLNCTIGTANDIYDCMIGLDSATTKAPASLAGMIRCSAGGANEGGNIVAKYRGLPGIGRHFLTVLEGRSAGTGTITVFGDNGALYFQSGILGSSQG